MDIKKKNLYETEIANVPLKLLSEHSDELVHEMVSLVDQKVTEALSKHTTSVQDAAILAALNIAEELILLKSQANDRLADLTKKTEIVLNQLESSRVRAEIQN